MKTISNEGVKFIAHFEGFRSKPYLDSVGIATIGYGTITYPDTGRKVTLKDPAITEDTALEYLKLHIEKSVTSWIVKNLPGLTQNQFDALVSFCYNLGVGALSGSTLERRILVKDTCDRITQAFMMWTKARVNGKLTELKGLVRRREAEADLYCKGIYK
jgi:lysozyme